MAMEDFIMTIDSDEEQIPSPKVSRSVKSQNLESGDEQLNADFTFDLAGDPYVNVVGESNLQDLVKKGSRPVS